MTKTKHKNCILTCLDCGCECMTFNPDKTQQITTQAEARQYAIDWQVWSSERSISLEEIMKYQEILTELATRFNLTEEFKENWII